MTTASAKVIIDAEDLASKKIAEAARNVERSVKNIKDVGGKAKASTEFIGTLATTLGGSQLGSYAGQLAQLTERVSAFSEVSKAGGAGALAFKAGLVGVAAVITYQVASAIASLVYDIKGAEKAMEEAFKGMDDAAQGFSTAQARRHAKDMAELQVGNAEEQTAKQTEKLKELNKELAFTGIRYKMLDVEQQNLAETASLWDQYVSGASKDAIADLEKRKQIEDANFKRLQSQQTEVRDLLDQETKDREARKEALTAQVKAEEDAAKAVVDAQKKAVAEAEKANQKKIAESERIANIRQNEIDRLKEESILLNEGAEAAKRFSLERQGVDKDSAARIARAQAELEEAKKGQGGPSSVSIGSQAVQSRLLTRGPAEKGIDKIAKNTEQTVEALDRLARELKDYGPPQPQLEVVG